MCVSSSPSSPSRPTISTVVAIVDQYKHALLDFLIFTIVCLRFRESALVALNILSFHLPILQIPVCPLVCLSDPLTPSSPASLPSDSVISLVFLSQDTLLPKTHYRSDWTPDKVKGSQSRHPLLLSSFITEHLEIGCPCGFLVITLSPVICWYSHHCACVSISSVYPHQISPSQARPSTNSHPFLHPSSSILLLCIHPHDTSSPRHGT